MTAASPAASPLRPQTSAHPRQVSRARRLRWLDEVGDDLRGPGRMGVGITGLDRWHFVDLGQPDCHLGQLLGGPDLLGAASRASGKRAG